MQTYYFSSQVILKSPFKMSQEHYIITLTQAYIFQQIRWPRILPRGQMSFLRIRDK